MTVQAGDAGVIYYKLRTDATPERTKNGVKLVSWEWGTDEEIAAMLEAAHNGTIDLQTDGLWEIGDVRQVDIGAWSGGGRSFDATTRPLVISSFAEYEGCGNVMQFDFLTIVNNRGVRMNDTGVNRYSESEMKTSTLPALIDALPSWLKNALITFSVKVGAGNNSSSIETVTGNKLALRSEVEITGTHDHSAAGEGSQVDLYRDSLYRTKYSSSTGYWLRSPYGTSMYYYCTDGSIGRQSANSTEALAPFGCL